MRIRMEFAVAGLVSIAAVAVENREQIPNIVGMLKHAKIRGL
jgi:hypothetical protein